MLAKLVNFTNVFSAPRGWLSLVAATIVSAFFFFDEEPMLDPTDWNIVHILLLLLSIIVVINENVIRSRHGQYVFKDQVLMFTTFSFWFSIENWCRLIVVVFCFHCLSPLELELIELNEVFSSLQTWYTAKLIPSFLVVILVYALLLLLNMSLNWVTARVLATTLFVSLIILLLNFIVMLWDFLLSSMSGVNFSSNRGFLYFNNSRASINYDSTLMVDDLFDWHVSNSSSFIFRFEDAYCFFLQLFNIVALYTLIFVTLFSLLDTLLAEDQTVVVVNSLPSFTNLGVVLRWFDHVWFSFFISHFSVFFVSLRIFFKVCLDFNF